MTDREFWRAWRHYAALTGSLWIVVWGICAAFIFARGLYFTIVISVLTGLLFGILFGFALALKYRQTRLVLSADELTGHADLSDHLTSLGFRKEDHPSPTGVLTFSPGWRNGILAGRVRVSSEDDRTMVSGPRVFIERLQERLDRRGR